MECEIASDWSIDEKALLEVKENGYLESPRIQTTIPGVEYCIQIRPYEKIERTHNVYLNLLVKTNTIIYASYAYTIPSANFSETFDYEYDDNDGEDEQFVFFRRSLYKYFENGKLTLQLRGTLAFDLMDESERKSLGDIFWTMNDKDFTIQTEDKDIRAHKLILRVRSPVFAAMFDSGMKEAEESKVKIEGFSYKVVKAAIEFCYDVKLCHTSVIDLLSLLKFSDVYDIAHLKNYVEQKLAKKLSPDNICNIANASIKTNAEKLRTCCINFLIKWAKDSTAIAHMDSLDADLKCEFVRNIVCHKM